MLVLPSIAFGQRAAEAWWIDAGLKVQTGFTGLYNSEFVESTAWDYDISRGTAFGGKLGLNYDSNGVTLDVMYSRASHNSENASIDENIKLDWTAIDLYLMWRNNKRLGYFELGPKYSLINGVDRNSALSAMTVDATDDFSSNEISAVLGFGVYLLGSDGAFSGIFGFRLEYGITDFTQNDNALLGDAVLASASSHPIFAGIVFELNWGIGYVGRASCGQRSKFMKF
jgi:hypothetical protein